MAGQVLNAGPGSKMMDHLDLSYSAFTYNFGNYC